MRLLSSQGATCFLGYLLRAYNACLPVLAVQTLQCHLNRFMRQGRYSSAHIFFKGCHCTGKLSLTEIFLNIYFKSLYKSYIPIGSKLMVLSCSYTCRSGRVFIIGSALVKKFKNYSMHVFTLSVFTMDCPRNTASRKYLEVYVFVLQIVFDNSIVDLERLMY